MLRTSFRYAAVYTCLCFARYCSLKLYRLQVALLYKELYGLTEFMFNKSDIRLSHHKGADQ
jgi:hypothetical protein